MKCPSCGHPELKVLQTREGEGGASIRRRRECQLCGERFTTFERFEKTEWLVLKKDGRREPYDQRKILTGLQKACEKRPVEVEQLVEMLNRVEQMIQERGDVEVPSQTIGEFIVEMLKETDEVAYIRFASVYRRFKDVREFHEILKQFPDSATSRRRP
jgi:transcriptional repressor NrdR